MRLFVFTYLFAFFLCGFDVNFARAEQLNPAFSNSGLSVPRFVSLAKDEANVRVGPGREYPVQHVYKRRGLPVEVILEFENWRKIRDHHGDEGWVYHTLLSGERYGVVVSDRSIYAFEKPYDLSDGTSRAVIELEPFVQLRIEQCDGEWCRINASGFYGWIERKFIWGVYEHENFD